MTATGNTQGRVKARPAGRQPRAGAVCERDESNIRPRMSSAAANLKGIIDAGLKVHARLRESPTGDVVNLAVDSMFLSRSSRLRYIIDALKELEDHGLVHRSEIVSPGDSSEYLLTWSPGEIEPTERPWRSAW